MTDIAMDCDDCSRAIIDLPENNGLDLDEIEEKYMLEDCRCVKKILCEYCKKPATNETGTLNVYVCEKNECIIELATEQWILEEVTDDEHKEYGDTYKKGTW